MIFIANRCYFTKRAFTFVIIVAVIIIIVAEVTMGVSLVARNSTIITVIIATAFID